MEKQFKTLLIIVFFILFAVRLFSQQYDGIVTYHPEKEYYTCPKSTAEDLGIKYPYQVGYLWEYSYIDPKYGYIRKGISYRPGEDANVFISPYKLNDVKVRVTSFNRSGDYFTGLVYKEYRWYQKSFDTDSIQTLTIKPLETKR